MGKYGIFIMFFVVIYSMYMGYNDGSLAISTTIVTRATKPRTALLITALIKFIVPIISLITILTASGGVGLEVANKLGSQLFISTLPTEKEGFVFLFSGLMGSLLWAVISYFAKLPNSITHTLIGGIIGAGIVNMGFFSVNWKGYVLLNVIAMVFIAPAVAFVIGFILLKIIKKLASRAPNRHVGNILVWVQRINFIFLSASFASNNWQKTFGVVLLASSIGAINLGGNTMTTVVVVIAVSMMIGILTGGTKIIMTTGKKLFNVGPIHSVTAQLTASLVSTVSNTAGIALGVGQAMTASIIGAGTADRMNAVKWARARKVAIGWALTFPIAALFGAGFYALMATIVGIPL